LKRDGELLLTVPYKSQRNVVYMDGAVFERGATGKNFFAREYDKPMFDGLIDRSGFSRRDSWLICERGGIFPADYYEWGPGKDSVPARVLIKSRALLERILRKSLDETLARQYLSVSRESTGRLVNIAARLAYA